MDGDLVLFEVDEGSDLLLLAPGEFPDEGPEQAWFFIHAPSRWSPAFRRRSEDDLDEQLERAAREAQLQQLGEARGVAAGRRLEQKRLDDARALSLMSAQRNQATARDPLHRLLPKAAATATKEVRSQRTTEQNLPPAVKEKMDTNRRDAALADAQVAAEAKRNREEEIRQTRLKNLAKARKAKRK